MKLGKVAETTGIFQTLTKVFRGQAAKTQLNLGRWNKVDDIQLTKRIDWANSDHCGPCGVELLKPLPKRKVTVSENFP